MLVQKLKLVAYAPNGLQRPLVGDTLQLLAEALDVNVHGAGVTQVVKAPDLIEQGVTGEHAVVVRGQEVEQLQLLGGISANSSSSNLPPPTKT